MANKEKSHLNNKKINDLGTIFERMEAKVKKLELEAESKMNILNQAAIKKSQEIEAELSFMKEQMTKNKRN